MHITSPRSLLRFPLRFLGLAALLCCAAAPALAQIYPVAKVDGEIISNYDVEQRARLLALTARNADKQALRLAARDELIDEQLKLNETEKLKIAVSDEELQKELNSLAQRNGMNKTGYYKQLAQAGVSSETFERRIRTTLAWNELLRRRHLKKIQPTEGEVDLEMEIASKRQSSGKKLYDIKQLLIGVPRGASREQILAGRQKAFEARKKLKNCAALKQLAPKYSRGSGDIGRFPAEAMPEGLRPKLLALKPNQSTEPLLNVEGWHIYMLCGISQGSRPPNKEQIRGLLAMRKAENISRSLVADLRRDALIEYAQ